MKQRWLERLRNAIADRGRDLLKRRPSLDLRNPSRLCAELVSGRHGEASGVALSREILRSYVAMDEAAKLAFFEMMERDFGPDAEAIRKTTARFLETRSTEDYLALASAVEPRRQELFRRMNMAPQGTAALVRMRSDLLGLLRGHPDLRVVDADLRHLLASWFNRGFLQIRSITWQSPAHILEKLIAYESVHAIHGWEDLRRRLADDRRCFAFFHPAMPDEPLIFVEVALVPAISTAVQPLLDPAAPVLELEQVDTAIFYSINNTQVGLRGISFGNFLIKQVVEELRAEIPGLKRFCTLSPLPRFATTLRAALKGEKGGLDPALVQSILAEHAPKLVEAAGLPSPTAAMLHLLEGPAARRQVLSRPLQQLALAYLMAHSAKGLVDPVASFHLSNGARLEAIHPFADTSTHGLTISFGTMVNYLYVPEEVEENHERFVATGEVPMSKGLARLKKSVLAAETAGRKNGRKTPQPAPA